MVLIHSRQGDDTTIDIIKWLRSFGKDTYRINNINDYNIANLLVDGNAIVSSYLNGYGLQALNVDLQDRDLKMQIESYLGNDQNTLWSNLLSKLKGKPVFGAPPFQGNILNKLNVLDAANELGFLVPLTEVVSSKKRLTTLKNEWGRIICKSIADGITIRTKEVMIHGQKTEEINSDILDQLPEHFFPTLVQPLIEKQFEVRTFIYKDIVRSIAIFTQSSELTTVDGRLIDLQRPQRRIPFLLPDDLKEMSTKLLEVLSLNYGSFDFIVTPENEFYFLEVNPFGQYGFLSSSGNFYIEKQIAKKL